MLIDKLPSRSRSVILWAIGSFFAAQLVLAIVIERWRPEWSDPEYGYRLHHLRQRILENPDHPLLVVLGSSRVGQGFKADVLPPPSWNNPASPIVFNMSLSGGTPVHELLFIKRLLAAGIHPRWVVIEVLPASLKGEADILAAKDILPPNRLRWTDLQVLQRHAPQHSVHRYEHWFKVHAFSSYFNRFAMVHCWAPALLDMSKPFQSSSDEMSPHGWHPFPYERVSPELYQSMFQVARKAYAPILSQFRIVPEADRIFREMLDVCRHEEIEVIGLLRMPEATDFRALYPPETSRLIDRYLRDLCRQYETEYIDASQWLSDDNFADGHHLLPQGAERFSLRLWDEVLEKHPLFRERPEVRLEDSDHLPTEGSVSHVD